MIQLEKAVRRGRIAECAEMVTQESPPDSAVLQAVCFLGTHVAGVIRKNGSIEAPPGPHLDEASLSTKEVHTVK